MKRSFLFVLVAAPPTLLSSCFYSPNKRSEDKPFSSGDPKIAKSMVASYYGSNNGLDGEKGTQLVEVEH